MKKVVSLFVFLILGFQFVAAAESGEISTMITSDFYYYGEDCELYSLAEFRKKVITPLRSSLPDFEKEIEKEVPNATTKEMAGFLANNIWLKGIKLIEKLDKIIPPIKLKDMKKKGWKITYVEKVDCGFYGLSTALKKYMCEKEEPAHIFIFEK